MIQAFEHFAEPNRRYLVHYGEKLETGFDEKTGQPIDQVWFNEEKTLLKQRHYIEKVEMIDIDPLTGAAKVTILQLHEIRMLHKELELIWALEPAPLPVTDADF